MSPIPSSLFILQSAERRQVIPAEAAHYIQSLAEAMLQSTQHSLRRTAASIICRRELLPSHQSFRTATRFQTLTSAHAFAHNHVSRDKLLQHDERTQLCRPSFSSALPPRPAAVARRYTPGWRIVSIVFHSLHALASLLRRFTLLLTAPAIIP